MFAVLPFLAIALLALLFHKRGNGWRPAILLAALWWGVLIVFSTELLSLVRGFTFWSVLLFWLVVDGVLLWGYKTSKVVRPPTAHTDTTDGEMPDGYGTAGHDVADQPAEAEPFPLFLKGLIASTVLIVAAVGLVALIAPPNTWDSMTYHMSRVAHWIQNRSVDHYPTMIQRQLYSGPWSGFAIAHLQLLSGGDRFANLMQWLGMAGSVMGVSLIAEQLGAARRGQIFAATICATIPMGILQGSSTQTDYVVAFWLVSFVYFVLLTIQDKWNPVHAPKIAASIGLAVLAKGTGYLYGFPFGVWLTFSGIKRLGWKLWRPYATMTAIGLALNISMFWRNFQVYGSIFGKSDGEGNEAMNPLFLLSNIIRNLALHLSTPVRSINLITIGVVQQFHRLIGVDVSEPLTTAPPGQKFDMHSRINHEDLAGNALHLFLFFASVGGFLLLRKHMRSRQQYFLATYMVAIAVGFVLFCYLITWSPWRSRLHLPVFVLASASVGTILASLPWRKLANAVTSVLVMTSLIWVLCSESRPLLVNSQIVESKRLENIFVLSRTEQYFINRPDLKDAYLKAIETLQAQPSCENVGLLLGGDAWEYPFWTLLRDRPGNPIRFEHVDINNESLVKANSAYQAFSPCALVASERSDKDISELRLNNKVYSRAWYEAPVSVYLEKKGK